jgi:hypothetical protein
LLAVLLLALSGVCLLLDWRNAELRSQLRDLDDDFR